VDLGSIQVGDSGFRLLCFCHLHERKTARLPGIAIFHYVYSLYSTVRSKRFMQLILRCVVAEIADKDIRHNRILLRWNGFVSLSDCTGINSVRANLGGRAALVSENGCGQRQGQNTIVCSCCL
jgi:hypothetical protein